MERKQAKLEKKSDHLKKFFETMEETVRTFPPSLQIEVKSKIYNLVTEYEYKNLVIKENRQQQVQLIEHTQNSQPPAFQQTVPPWQPSSSTSAFQYQSHPHSSTTHWQPPESASPIPSDASQQQNFIRSYDCYPPPPPNSQ